MTRVWTLTLNPAIDIGSEAERVVPNRKLRCESPTIEAGGGGVNVSRALRRLGQESTAVFPVGGDLGRFYQQLLEGESIECEPFDIGNHAHRFNTNFRESESGDQYRFCMPGVEMAEAEWRKALDLLRDRLQSGDLLVVSGSLPPGVPADVVGKVAVLVKEKEARLILDAPGEVLSELVNTPVDWIKPNENEMEGLLGHELDPDKAEDELSAFMEKTAIQHILLTLGEKGAVYAGEEGVQGLPAPEIHKVSTVGAGDSSLAGLVLGLKREEGPLTSSQWAVAAGSATAKTPGTHLLNEQDFINLAREVGEKL